MVRQFLSIASFKTASKCWVPAAARHSNFRPFSSRERCVHFNNAEHEGFNLIANDDVLSEAAGSHSEVIFEPTVHSSEEVFTAGPVNKA
ncbi:hypothetical protein METSCH_D07950 [Metschnikowia aff. pulcherrima]|uniref:Uncharacterized protein n=1 Tax=Metschnikowia aff. pulcherrima TaxID=2163413 RepID=A0A4P6XUU2_9ASCO|nr:hypothetical protein METSCH_D07950 [Metschnikowia aff. pulcherrima]